ncbi:MAG: response regulator [Clostridia bacterium]|nr:response regulator [Clostridia bacterium]
MTEFFEYLNPNDYPEEQRSLVEEFNKKAEEGNKKATDALILVNAQIAENKLTKEKEYIIDAVSSDYLDIFIASPESDSALIFKLEGFVPTGINKEMSKIPYYMGLKGYANDRVVSEDIDYFLECMSVENVKKELEDKNTYEFTYRVHDGNETKFYAAHIVKISDGRDELRTVVGFKNVDQIVADKEEAKKALADALETAQHSNRAKTLFLNNMSHDIRTPMNAIIGFTALAGVHIDNKEQVLEYLKKISKSADHLLSLINDVLDMSRIESGKVKLDEKKTHLPDVLHDLRTILQSSITAKSQELYIDTSNVVDEDIIIDKLRLNQVLLNVVSNAIKYTPNGGIIAIRVIQKACDRSGYAHYEFRIKDNGIGMSEEFKNHIFESFTRERTSTVSGIEGTGLGMAITKNIVDLMGGTIEVNSSKGKGSEFIVNIECRLSGEKVVVGPVPELVGNRALVVDDDVDTCINVSKMLRDVGMRSDWTTSGKESVLRAKDAYESKDEFKVYIIDWQLPDLNGIETVRRIRKVIGNSVPIIIMTAYDWSDIEDEAREAGVTAFVSKPIFLSELRDVLVNPYRAEEMPEKLTGDEDFTGRKILLVEDNELNQEIAKEILTEAGFEVDVASDGDISIEKVRYMTEGQYDIVLMDIQMPRMDGYTATRQIRTLDNPVASTIPIIAMTANAFEEDKRKAFESGMNGFVTKPIDVSKLISVIKEFLE